MAVGDANVFSGFLIPALTFQSQRLLSSHASAEVRGENTTERKNRLNRGSNSQPPGHDSDTLTNEPPGRGLLVQRKPEITRFKRNDLQGPDTLIIRLVLLIPLLTVAFYLNRF